MTTSRGIKLSLGKSSVGLGVAMAILLALPRTSWAQEPDGTYEQSSGTPEDPLRSTGSGLVTLGYMLTTAGIIVGALGIGSLRGASPNSTAENRKNDRQLFVIIGASMAAATSGLALQTLGYSARRDAFIEAGYEPNRTMAAPWTFMGIGGAMAAAGVGMAAVGLHSKSDGLGVGGAVLASAGAIVGMCGAGLARATKYSLVGLHSSDGLSVRPWLAPVVTTANLDSPTGRGLAAGLSGTF
jgi:hypothetical protein